MTERISQSFLNPVATTEKVCEVLKAQRAAQLAEQLNQVARLFGYPIYRLAIS